MTIFLMVLILVVYSTKILKKKLKIKTGYLPTIIMGINAAAQKPNAFENTVNASMKEDIVLIVTVEIA
jgi:hypothetical protein